MFFGPTLCALAAICFVLIGPFGPCGPATPFGYVFLLGGFASAVSGWIVSVYTIGLVAWKGDRSGLWGSTVIAALLAGAVAAIVALTSGNGGESQSDGLTLGLYSWPPLILVTLLARRQLRKA